MKRVIATVVFVASVAVGEELAARTVFIESFAPHPSNDYILPDFGWTAHYGGEGTPFFPVPQGYSKESQPYIRLGQYILDNKPGEGMRDAVYSGTAPKLVWTDKIGAAAVDVSRLSIMMFDHGRQTAVRPAIQLDGGTTWYAMSRTFAPVSTRMIEFQREGWNVLTFEPEVEMTLGGTISLPMSGMVTAFGFYYQNAEPSGVTDDLQLSNIVVEAYMEAPGLIASESFWTTGNGYNGVVYSSLRSYAETTNATITVGNAGFSPAFAWVNSNNRLQPSSAVSLTHPGVTGVSRSGSTHLRVNNFNAVNYRQSCRPLVSEPPVTNAYYLSGLIRVTALDLNDGEAVAVGFDNISALTTALTNGFHFGVRKENGRTWLSAFAGKQAFTLAELDESATGRVWQVVLKLTADAQGMDALTAWYAREDATALTRAFKGVSVETYAGPASIRSLRLTTRACGRNGTDADAATYIYADEIRLGTSLAAVTTLDEPSSGGTMISVR